MTNLEYLRTAPREELVDFLCAMFEDEEAQHCDECPMSKYCFIDHNGFNEWLDKEVDEEEESDNEED